MERVEELWLECECHYKDHSVVASYEDNESGPYMYVDMVMDRIPFKDRVRTAWRYVWTGVCRYGDVAEVILNEEKATKIRDLLNRYIG